jgi:hypothetical protein
MASEIRSKTDAKAAFTITLASLAAAAGRQSTMINNSTLRPGAIVYVEIETNASAPTAGQTYDVYLLRGNDASSSTYRTDGAGASDAAITIANAQRIGSIVVTASANTKFYGEFDTAVAGQLGPEWGIAVVNNTGQAANATAANHYAGYVAYVPEAQ